MKRGWWILAVLIITTIAFVSAKTYDFEDCWGVKVCNRNYTCGTLDGICVDDFFEPDSIPDQHEGCAKEFPTEGYSKCIDPDCISCVSGRITEALSAPAKPVNAIITYTQDVWNSTGVETLKIQTTTNSTGHYNFTIGSGNEIYIIVEAAGYTSELVGPIFDLDPRLQTGCLVYDFQLANGTCQSDCTRFGSVYCDASCQGEGVPGDLCEFNQTIDYTTSDLQDIVIESPLSACTKLGTQTKLQLVLGNFSNSATGIKTCVMTSCCEGNAVFEVACPEPTISSTLISGRTLENAIKITRIAKEKGNPIKINVYYWE